MKEKSKLGTPNKRGNILAENISREELVEVRSGVIEGKDDFYLVLSIGLSVI